MQDLFRSIPSVDKCVKALLDADSDLENVPPAQLKHLVNSYWEKTRQEIRKGEYKGNLNFEEQLEKVLDFVRQGLRPRLREVLNATGVIIHTNLGRSILAEQAVEAVRKAASSYCSLEMDLESGERGSRHSLVNELICRLTGAEDSMVVNNNAAAVLLVLDTLCRGGETIVSRGELVEIGGSFRIPDIMSKSGTILREVGTTNRTHLDDYKKAINENTKAIMRVHASNFRIVGFHKEVSLKDLKSLASSQGLPLIFDLGSGNLLNLKDNGLPFEPVAREILAQGADCICFSGDKALGGPQAGIIAGKANLVEQFKRNPLSRALRCDKLCLAALEATLRLYLDPELAKKAVPTVAMMSISAENLAKKARSLAGKLRRVFRELDISCQVKIRQGFSRVGGGAFPEYGLPTSLVCLYPEGMSVEKLRERLLKDDPPLVGRVEKDAFCIDPRTLARDDFPLVSRVLARGLGGK